MASSKHFSIKLFFLLISVFCLAALSSAKGDDHLSEIQNKTKEVLHENVDYSCVYTVYVRTSKTWNGGTDSIISVAFYDDTRSGLLIKDLEKWGGVMEDGHDYYERGNLDIFTGLGPCLSRPLCSMKLMSDGSGEHHGWYCNYVEVTSTGPHSGCDQQLFTVEQWLALDRSPHELTAVRNSCSQEGLGVGRTKNLPIKGVFVV